MAAHYFITPYDDLDFISITWIHHQPLDFIICSFFFVKVLPSRKRIVDYAL